jgi:hypothetical protein
MKVSGTQFYLLCYVAVMYGYTELVVLNPCTFNFTRDLQERLGNLLQKCSLAIVRIFYRLPIKNRYRIPDRSNRDIVAIWTKQ